MNYAKVSRSLNDMNNPINQVVILQIIFQTISFKIQAIGNFRIMNTLNIFSAIFYFFRSHSCHIIYLIHLLL